MDTVLRLVPATAADLDLLVSLEQETFKETFEHLYEPEDFGAFIRDKKSKAALEKEMNATLSRYFILYDGAQPVGFLKLNLDKQPDNAPPQEAPVMQLEKIYVLKVAQGKRAGQFMMDFALATAREQGVRTIWLGVWEHNTRALRFYEKNGFQQFGNHYFIMGKQKDIDLLVRKHL